MAETKVIQIEVPANKKAEWQEVNGKLTLVCVDEEDNRPVTERIKTFEDACKAVGIDAKKWLEENETSKMDENLLAYLKLRIIIEALNEGWKPKFDVKEYRYAPYFYTYTQEEVDEMDEDEKASLLCVGCSARAGSICGLSAPFALYAFSYSDATIGSRLTLKSRELAIYCGNQFRKIWFDFIFK